MKLHINVDAFIQGAMKDGNSLKANVWRSIKTKLMNVQKAKKRKSRELTDEDMQNALKLEFKELQDEMDANMKALRSAICKAVGAKMSYISPFIKKENKLEPLSNIESIKLVEAAVLKVTSSMGEKANMGLVMKTIKDTGQNVDMKFIAMKVKELMS